MVDAVIAANPQFVEQFRAGKEGVINALVGQVMKQTRGRADARQVQQLLRDRLARRSATRGLDPDSRSRAPTVACELPPEGSDPAVGGRTYDSRRVDGKRYLITPGPTPVPPEVVAAEAAPLHHHRSPDFRALLGETLAALKRVFADRERRAALHRLGHGGDGVVGRQPALAGRSGGRRLGRELRRALAQARARLRHRAGARRPRVGRAPRPGPDRRRGRGGRNGGGVRHPVGDVDRGRARHRDASRHATPRPAPCSWSTPSRAWAGWSSPSTRGASTWPSPARRRR